MNKILATPFLQRQLIRSPENNPASTEDSVDSMQAETGFFQELSQAMAVTSPFPDSEAIANGTILSEKAPSEITPSETTPPYSEENAEDRDKFAADRAITLAPVEQVALSVYLAGRKMVGQLISPSFPPTKVVYDAQEPDIRLLGPEAVQLLPPEKSLTENLAEEKSPQDKGLISSKQAMIPELPDLFKAEMVVGSPQADRRTQPTQMIALAPMIGGPRPVPEMANLAAEQTKFSTLEIPSGEDQSRWIRQLESALGERLQWQVSNRVQQVRIRLDPPEMGKIDIAMQLENGRVQLSIQASHGEVFRALQQISHELRQNLIEQNFPQVNVQIFSQSGQQQREKGQQTAERKLPLPSINQASNDRQHFGEQDSVLLIV